MTANRNPTKLGSSILEAMMLSGTTQTEAQAALGVSYNTWRKRLASDSFTVHDLIRISGLTGIALGTIIPHEYMGQAASGTQAA